MTESTGQISKMVAIQYGLLIAGTVLLIIAYWDWYKTSSTPCKTSCTAEAKTCLTKCTPAVAANSPTTSGFYAGMKSDKITENMLHEGFVEYGSDDDCDTAGPYDPAMDSLDRAVFDSHNEFVEESFASSTGPSSANIERDDTNEVVKRWGLRRVDYTSVHSSDDSRTVSSEYPEQVAQKTSSAETDLF